MAKLFSLRQLKNNRGQSLVEYILLVAVLVSLGYAVFHNKKFLTLIGDKEGGMFYTMKVGMSYTYRYGVEYDKAIQPDTKAAFNYTSGQHDTYSTSDFSASRFFTGADPYPQQ